MPKSTRATGSTNGPDTVDKPVDRLNGNGVVSKVEVGGQYVWKGGKAPENFSVIFFIGSDDPATTVGGRDSDDDVWLGYTV